MTFLILSDSHRKSENIRKAAERCRNCDAILFLGDGVDDFSGEDRFMSMPVYKVRGNCDLFSFPSQTHIPEELILHFDEYTVMMMHGHHLGVKSGYDTAIAYAAAKGADILLFGHTHIPFEKYIPAGEEFCGTVLKKPLYIFNPGSVGEYSFGTMTLKKNGVLFGHGTL